MAGGAQQDGQLRERFRQIALPCLDDVYTLARYLTRNSSDADDAVQECYLRAFRNFSGYRGPEIKPWLFAILRNVCHAMSSRGRGLVFTAETMDGAVPIWGGPGETPESVAVQSDDMLTMRRLISALPLEFREVVVLREIEDMPYREIATIVGVPIGTVMSRLARGRALLREACAAPPAKDEER
ncbi:MAG: sigma-70 family RNA polymerase sigma factor [Pseudolabrys sp.]|nr:sigma-70 family RNA polymerase sigma factor [Pseudolabrys sp.]